MKKSANTPFVDVGFLIGVGFALLFIVAIMQIQVEHKDADIETHAEYIIALTWQKADHDVDVWVQDPQKNLLFFKSKEVGIMHLDRDDLGNRHDTYEENGEIKIIPTNQEIVTIRGFMSGEWIVNTHFYRVGKNDTDKTAKCNVIVTKLNPRAKIVLNRDFVLESYWQEKTIARFLMTANGDIFLQDVLPVKLVSSKMEIPLSLAVDGVR